MAELEIYGWSLFLGFPLIIGLSAGLMPFKEYKMLGVYFGLAAFLALLVLGHYEDIVCIIYALPLTLAMIAVGYFLSRKKDVEPNRMNVIIFPLLFFGLTTLPDHLFGNSYQKQTVSTSLYLPYSPEEVFDKIKSVDTLHTDKPFFMSLGPPVPQKCVLEAEKVGAKRTCYLGVVGNHFHSDGIGGLRVFHEANIPSYANVLTNAQSDTIVKAVAW